MTYAALILVAGLLPPRPAHAWGELGHETIGLMAEKKLSPGALAKVRAILGFNGDGSAVGLKDIAVCADAIKRKSVDCPGVGNLPMDDSTKDWHFIDIVRSEDPDAVPLDKYCAGQGCVVDQINNQLAVLKAAVDDASPIDSAERKKALMFLVHLVGDEHQPLHCAQDNDEGGNAKAVAFNPKNEASVTPEAAAKPRRRPKASGAPEPTPAAAHHAEMAGMNLHHLWDNVIETDSSAHSNTPEALASQLAGAQPTDPCAAADLVNCPARESFRIAKDTIYQDYYANDPDADQPSVPYRLGSAYQARMQPLAYGQLALAAARLAALLEANLPALPAK